jgi:hypothetical protein
MAGLFGSRLPRAVRSELARRAPGEAVLGWAPTAEGHAVALAGHLAVGGADGWELVAWHDLVRGAWDPQAGRLTWRDGAGQAGGVALAEPGNLPPVFRERLDATFLVEERIGPRQGGVSVTVQRSPADPAAPLVYRVTPDEGCTAADLAEAAARLEEFRRDLE